MRAVDERAVARIIGIEVVAEAPVDEDVDHVAERRKRTEMELSDQQGEDVLRPDPLEAFLGAVPVLVELLGALQGVVVALPLGQLAPELVHALERLGPAHVPVAPDDVARHERAALLEGAVDRVEQVFELRDVVQ